MEESIRLARWTRCQNAAHVLNRQAWEQAPTQKKYRPCTKARVYIEACNKGNTAPMMVVTQEAALAPCDCHTSITFSKLLDYEFIDHRQPQAK